MRALKLLPASLALLLAIHECHRATPSSLPRQYALDPCAFAGRAATGLEDLPHPIGLEHQAVLPVGTQGKDVVEVLDAGLQRDHVLALHRLRRPRIFGFNFRTFVTRYS